MKSGDRRVEVTLLGGADPLPSELPMAVQVEFTSRCNLRCRMCPLTTGTSSSSQAPGPMSEVVFEEVLRIARRCRSVVLAGYGEPLTNPQCLPMLRVLDAEAIDVAMATNGIGLTVAVAQELVTIEHLRLINVSIDSPDPTVYREVRGGNVDRALQGLRNLMAVIDDRDRVMVTSVAMHSNLASLVSFPAILADLGVPRYNLQAVIDYNDYSLQQRLLDRAEVSEHFEEIERACVVHGVRLDFSVPERAHADLDDATWARERFYGFGEWDERVTRQCHVPWQIPFIDKDGRVFSCCFAASADERRLGQIGPETFDEIWAGEKFKQFRRDIVDGATTPEICRRCTVAPLGEHPFKTWAAEVLSGRATVASRTAAAVSISVRNVGARSWTPADHVRIGTGSPRDSDSHLAHPDWLARNRPATFLDPVVRSGDVATFEFPIAFGKADATATFEIVADGGCWLPNTRFAVRVGSRGRSALPRVLRAGPGFAQSETT